MNTQKLQSLGNLWEKDGRRRIYMNNLVRWYGEDNLRRYGTKRVLARLSYGKLWYDLETLAWGFQGLESSDVQMLTANIERECA